MLTKSKFGSTHVWVLLMRTLLCFKIEACGEMKPLRVMNIHKSVCVTSCNDVLTEARGNIYADSTLISYVIWSPLSSVYGTLYQIVFHFFLCI